MNKYVVTLIAFLLFQLNIFAQLPTIEWTKTFGGTDVEGANSVNLTSDGGYIITGLAYSTTNGSDLILIKTDSEGNLMWQKTFGGSNYDIGFYAIETLDGGYAVTGFTSSFGVDYYDIWVIKTDSSGNAQWSRTYGGSLYDTGECIQQMADGNYIIAGHTSSEGAGSFDVLLLKVDSNGNPFWQKTYGGSKTDAGKSVDITSDGGFIVTGYQASFSIGVTDVSLMKTDSNGNIIWLKNFGGTDKDRGHSVKQTSDGGFIVTGFTMSFGSGQEDVWLIKTDSLGNEEWSKTFGGVELDIGQSVVQTPDGGFIVAGTQESITAGDGDIGLLKTDAAGNLLWFINIGGTDSDVANSIVQSSDGGYLIAGTTRSFGAGGSDIYLVKIKSEVSAVDDVAIPADFHLSQNYPNPFNPATKITYHVPIASMVVIQVYDMLGNKLETLVDEEKSAGKYEINWDAENLASGVYFYKLIAGEFQSTKKMILLR